LIESECARESDFSTFDFLSTSYLPHIILFSCVHISISSTSDASEKKVHDHKLHPNCPFFPNLHELPPRCTYTNDRRGKKKKEKEKKKKRFVPKFLYHIRHPLIQPKNITFQRRENINPVSKAKYMFSSQPTIQTFRQTPCVGKRPSGDTI